MNFDLPSLPSLPLLPSLPSLPSLPLLPFYLWRRLVLLVPSDACYKAWATFHPTGHPIHLPRHFSTRPDTDGSGYLQLENKEKKNPPMSFPRHHFFPYSSLGKRTASSILFGEFGGPHQNVVNPGAMMLQPG